ncbi:MAG: hypothetical protein JWN69_218 [Alphaproteobacteria bacterium]|nr:hypothetical protein [Alphaproteobacteria bacterium]
MSRTLFLVLASPVIAASAAAAEPSVAREQTGAAAPTAEVIPTKWTLAGPAATPGGRKAGVRKPVARTANRKPSIYGGARIGNSRPNGGVRSGAQVGVKLPF